MWRGGWALTLLVTEEPSEDIAYHGGLKRVGWGGLAFLDMLVGVTGGLGQLGLAEERK